MRYRKIGSTKLVASEIGFGTWAIGGLTAGQTSYGPMDDERSYATLFAAFEAGITFFDTAPAYGNGHAEELLGTAFSGIRQNVLFATKVGHTRFDAPPDFSPRSIKESLEGSLKRLKTDWVDILQLHSPPSDLLENQPETYEILRQLKWAGKVRAIGFSAKAPGDLFKVLDRFPFDVVQLNFNMLDQRALTSELFPFLAVKNTGVIVRTPFNFGFLAGNAPAEFHPADHRGSWPPEQIERWRKAPEYFRQLNEGKERTLAALALQFCLWPPGVCTVIPGMVSPEEVRENVRALEGEQLSREEVDAIRKICRSHTLFNPR